MNETKKKIVIFQIKDMLFRANRERIEEFGAFFENGHDFLELMENVLELLEEQDNCENCAIAIEDRQHVVRCKDCKYWEEHHKWVRPEGGSYVAPKCNRLMKQTRSNWYCADGKRR